MDQAGVDKVLAQSRHELDSKTVSGPRGFGGPLGVGGCRRRANQDSLQGTDWIGLWRRKGAFLERELSYPETLSELGAEEGKKKKIPGQDWDKMPHTPSQELARKVATTTFACEC